MDNRHHIERQADHRSEIGNCPRCKCESSEMSREQNIQSRDEASINSCALSDFYAVLGRAVVQCNCISP